MRYLICLIASLSLAVGIVSGAEALSAGTFRVTASESSSNLEFEYSLSEPVSEPGYTRYKISFPSPVESDFPPNNTVPGELFVPEDLDPEGKHPAVVCLHIIHGRFDLERMLCARLASSGVVAMFFKQPYYGERGGDVGKIQATRNPGAFIGCLDQGQADTRRAMDILGALPGVDPEKVSITGISMGAVQAATFAGVDPKVHKAWITLGGGNLREIIMTARETRGIRAYIASLSDSDQEKVWQAVEKHEPLNVASGIKRLVARDAFRMLCAAEDEVVSPAFSRALAAAVGIEDQIIWLPGMGHYTALASFADIVDDICSFFGSDVPPDWQPAPITAEHPTAHQLLGKLLASIAAMLGEEPQEGRAHMCGFSAGVKLDGNSYEGKLALLRGTDGKFKIDGDFPVVGKAGVGCGSYPWIAGASNVVFCGTVTGEDEKETGIANMISTERLMRFRVATGALAGAALAPEVLQDYYSLEEQTLDNGQRKLTLTIKFKKTAGRVTTVFARDNTPRLVEWDFPGLSGEIRPSYWKLNSIADDSIFDAPPEMQQKAVSRSDAQRMLAAFFEYLLEAIE